MKRYLFILPLIFLFQSFSLHKFYVSVMEIHVNKQNNKLEIILRTFPDDIDRALKDNFHINPDNSKYNNYLQTYLKQNIRFAFDDKEIGYKILGTTKEDGFLVILIEISLNKTTKKLQIYDTFLLDEYDEQKNIIHFLKDNDKRSYILNKQNQQIEIPI